MRRNVVLTGMPGCGKSEIGKRISEKLVMEFIDVDAYIENNWGQIPEMFKLGEEYFRNIESEAVNILSQKQGCVISTGGGVVLRAENMSRLKQNGVIIFIDRPLELLMQEVDISHRPLLAGGRDKLKNLYDERIPLYRKYADIIIDNSRDIDDAVDATAVAFKEEIK